MNQTWLGGKNGKIEIIFKINMITNTTGLEKMCCTKEKRGTMREEEKKGVKSQLEQ